MTVASFYFVSTSYSVKRSSIFLSVNRWSLQSCPPISKYINQTLLFSYPFMNTMKNKHKNIFVVTQDWPWTQPCEKVAYSATFKMNIIELIKRRHGWRFIFSSCWRSSRARRCKHHWYTDGVKLENAWHAICFDHLQNDLRGRRFGNMTDWFQILRLGNVLMKNNFVLLLLSEANGYEVWVHLH